MIKYFVDEGGNYIGSFSGIKKGDKDIWPNFPDNGIEVQEPPQDARQKWDGEKWSDVALVKRPQEIAERLSQIDLESLRPLRAVAAGTNTKVDDDKLVALEQEASDLRSELSQI